MRLFIAIFVTVLVFQILFTILTHSFKLQAYKPIRKVVIRSVHFCITINNGNETINNAHGFVPYFLTTVFFYPYNDIYH